MSGRSSSDGTEYTLQLTDVSRELFRWCIVHLTAYRCQQGALQMVHSALDSLQMSGRSSSDGTEYTLQLTDVRKELFRRHRVHVAAYRCQQGALQMVHSALDSLQMS